MIIHTNILLVTLALIICIVATIRSIHFRKLAVSNDNRASQLQNLLESVQHRLDRLEEANTLNSFTENLNTAEITTKMQQSRLQANSSPESASIPDRYRYVNSLSDKGVSASDIGSILGVSINEAEQLVALSQLGQK